MSRNLFVPEDGSGTLEGTLQHIVFSSPESGWTVARLEVAGEAVPVVGTLSGVQPGETLRVTGRWVEDRKYGRQFRIESFLSVQPTTQVGIERYLGSGLVRGIGPRLARKLVQRFGVETLRVIEEESSRLREVPGLGRVRIAAIRDAWREQRGIRDVMVFLQSHAVSAAHAARIYKRYGAKAVAVVRDDPYRLARDVSGIGFASADRIAHSLGIEADSEPRIRAGILHVLDTGAEEGHCYVPHAELVEKSVALLEVDAQAVAGGIERLATLREVVVETQPERPVYLSAMHAVETSVALLLSKRLRRRGALGAGLLRETESLLAATDFELAEGQRHAVRKALEEPVLVVTGGPGTGKTTLVRTLLQALQRAHRTALLCAPTGRAARRLAEATGHPAQTIHRLLEWNPRQHAFQRCAQSPLVADCVIVDEVSMVDVGLFHSLLAALPDPATLLLVGDADQLPSVGPGAVLADLLASKSVPAVVLTEIFRQDEASRIVTNAHRIRDGEPPLLPPAGQRGDFVLVERRAPEDVLAALRRLVAERLPASLGVDPREGIQVLVPMHRGPLGARALNAELQELLNAGGMPIGSTGLRVGDKVMQTRNNYDLDVSNGDLGCIAGWNEEERQIEVRFEERRVRYEASEFPELALAYATTVHKSQGSEYPVVIVVLHGQHFVMLQRNLLYTAVTRAKRQVVLLGERRALRIALDNARVQSRWTGLASRLREATPLQAPPR